MRIPGSQVYKPSDTSYTFIYYIYPQHLQYFLFNTHSIYCVSIYDIYGKVDKRRCGQQVDINGAN